MRRSWRTSWRCTGGTVRWRRWRVSTRSGCRPRSACRGRPRRTWSTSTPACRLRQRLLDRAEHRLAVRVAALVVAHLAQLGGREVAEAVADLRGREVVVAEHREGGREAGGAAAAIDLAQHAVHPGLAPRAPAGTGRAPAGVRGRVVELIAAPPDQLLEVLHEVLGLAPAAAEEIGHEVVGVVP